MSYVGTLSLPWAYASRVVGAVVASKWLDGSPVAWASLGMAVIGQAISVGVMYATMIGNDAAQVYQITRNREEANERIRALGERVDTLSTSMNAIHGIKIDVEVIKTRMVNIDEILRRIERRGVK